MKRFFILAISTCCVWSALASPLQTLTILHINDTHSHIDPDAAAVQLAGQSFYTEIGGMARLDSAIKLLRQQNREKHIPTLLLHAGDAFKGTGYFEVHKSKVNSDLFNRLGVQAMALGNHEFDEGLQELETFGRDIQFPLLAANVDATDEVSLQKMLQPYALFGMSGEQLTRIEQIQQPDSIVAVIGLALQDMPQIAPNTGNLKFLDEINTAQTLINHLEQQGVSKIVLLTHLGFERDLAIASQLDGVDVVVGGHSHSYLADLTAWNKGADLRYATWVPNKTRASRTCVITAGQYTHLIGAVTLSFDKTGALEQCKGSASLLSSDKLYLKPSRELADLTVEPSIHKAFQQLPHTLVAAESSEIRTLIDTLYKPAVTARYGQKLTTVAQAIPHVRLPGTDGSDQHGSRVAPIIAQAMLEYVNQQDTQTALNGAVDVALVAAGGIRAGLDTGDLLEGHILMDVLPYETPLSVLTVKGAVLRELLQTTIQATLPVGAHAGKYPYGAGIRYSVTEQLTGKVKFDQLDVFQQGKWRPLKDQLTYRLVTTNYLANGNDGWQSLAAAQQTGTDRVDIALEAGQLRTYAVDAMLKNSVGDKTKYQPIYADKTLDCQHKPPALYCGSQNEAVLMYLRQQPLLLPLPATVTLHRNTK